MIFPSINDVSYDIFTGCWVAVWAQHQAGGIPKSRNHTVCHTVTKLRCLIGLCVLNALLAFGVFYLQWARSSVTLPWSQETSIHNFCYVFVCAGRNEKTSKQRTGPSTYSTCAFDELINVTYSLLHANAKFSLSLPSINLFGQSLWDPQEGRGRSYKLTKETNFQNKTMERNWTFSRKIQKHFSEEEDYVFFTKRGMAHWGPEGQGGCLRHLNIIRIFSTSFWFSLSEVLA